MSTKDQRPPEEAKATQRPAERGSPDGHRGPERVAAGRGKNHVPLPARAVQRQASVVGNQATAKFVKGSIRPGASQKADPEPSVGNLSAEGIANQLGFQSVARLSGNAGVVTTLSGEEVVRFGVKEYVYGPGMYGFSPGRRPIRVETVDGRPRLGRTVAPSPSPALREKAAARDKKAGRGTVIMIPDWTDLTEADLAKIPTPVLLVVPGSTRRSVMPDFEVEHKKGRHFTMPGLPLKIRGPSDVAQGGVSEYVAEVAFGHALDVFNVNFHIWEVYDITEAERAAEATGSDAASVAKQRGSGKYGSGKAPSGLALFTHELNRSTDKIVDSAMEYDERGGLVSHVPEGPLAGRITDPRFKKAGGGNTAANTANQLLFGFESVAEYGGLVKRTVFRMFDDPKKREVELPWKKPGTYVVRCVTAFKKARGGGGRAPSSAVLVVTVRQPRKMATEALDDPAEQLAYAEELRKTLLLFKDAKGAADAGARAAALRVEIDGTLLEVLTQRLTQTQAVIDAGKGTPNELKGLVEQRHTLNKLIAKATKKSAASKGGGSGYRLHAALVRTNSGEKIDLTFHVTEPTLRDGVYHTTLTDYTQPKGKDFSGAGHTPLGAVKAAVTKFRNDPGYDAGMLAVRIPKEGPFLKAPKSARTMIGIAKPRDGAQTIESLKDTAAVVGFATSLGGGRALAIASASVSGVVAAENIISRAREGTLALDGEMIGDVVGVIASVAGTGKAFADVGGVRWVSKGSRWSIQVKRASVFLEKVENASDYVDLANGSMEVLNEFAKVAQERKDGKISRLEARRRRLEAIRKSAAMTLPYARKAHGDAKRHREEAARRLNDHHRAEAARLAKERRARDAAAGKNRRLGEGSRRPDAGPDTPQDRRRKNDPNMIPDVAVPAANQARPTVIDHAMERLLGERDMGAVRNWVKAIEDPQARAEAETAVNDARQRIVDDVKGQLARELPRDFALIEARDTGTKGINSDVDINWVPTREPRAGRRHEAAQMVRAAARLSDRFYQHLEQRLGADPGVALDVQTFSYMGEGTHAPTSAKQRRRAAELKTEVAMAEYIREVDPHGLGSVSMDGPVVKAVLDDVAQQRGEAAVADVRAALEQAAEFHGARSRAVLTEVISNIGDPRLRGLDRAGRRAKATRLANGRLAHQKKMALASEMSKKRPDPLKVLRLRMEALWHTRDAYASSSAATEAIDFGQRRREMDPVKREKALDDAHATEKGMTQGETESHAAANSWSNVARIERVLDADPTDVRSATKYGARMLQGAIRAGHQTGGPIEAALGAQRGDAAVRMWLDPGAERMRLADKRRARQYGQKPDADPVVTDDQRRKFGAALRRWAVEQSVWSDLHARERGQDDGAFTPLKKTETPTTPTGTGGRPAPPALNDTSTPHSLDRPLERESAVATTGHKGATAKDRGLGVFEGVLDGRPVLVKVMRRQERFRKKLMTEMEGARAAELTGYGPAVHGMVDVGTNPIPGYGFAMDRQPGGFTDAGSDTASDRTEAAAVRASVTPATIEQLRDYGEKLIAQGYVNSGELQFVVDKSGGLRPIDFAGIHRLSTDPEAKKDMLESHKSAIDGGIRELTAAMAEQKVGS